MYPHVVQFETRRHEVERELQLLRERKQARTGWRQSARSPGRPGSRTLELEAKLTIERT